MNSPPVSPKRSSTVARDANWRVFYDADCGFCSRGASWRQRRKALVEVRWIPTASDEAQRLVPDRPVDEMGVAGPNGEIWFGGDAFIVTLWTLAGWRWLTKLLALPGIRHLVRWGYRLVARQRYQISRLLGDSCQIPPKP